MEAEEQAGFRAGRFTVDNLFTVTQVVVKKIALNQEVHVLYVDLKKPTTAYPKQTLGNTWENKHQYNIDKTIQELYSNNTSKIKKGQTLSKGFNVDKGLKQSCSLSPTLFKIYLQQALKVWKKQWYGNIT